MTDLDLVPTAMVAGGAALARDGGGRVVFVDGALPGERVLARLTDERRDFARAVAVEIVEPSADRVAPPCPALAVGCGGCSWQHVAGAAQLRLKTEIVVDALRRIGRLPDPPEPTSWVFSQPRLRTWARLGVTAEGRAGHRPRGSATGVVATESCQAAHPLLAELITEGVYPEAAEVLMRVGVASGERLVRVPSNPAAVRVPPDVSVVTPGDGRPDHVREEVLGRRFRISADSFFQPGPVAAAGVAQVVAEAVGKGLPGNGHLVDAYAGVGLFASVLGSVHGLRVTAVERSRAAAADARVNLADLDARVVCSEIGRWRPDRPVDAIVADPARSGLGRPGVAALASAGAPCLVLVACDPASLARDAALLRERGFGLRSVVLVDAFTDTFHIETVACFDR